MNAASYLRVSSKGQVDGDGFPRQREAVTQLAHRNGWQLLHEFRDEGVDGDLAWDERPGLCTMMMSAERLGIQVVVVEQSSRLGRDSVETEIAVRKCRELNIQVYTALDGQHLTTDTIDGVMVRQIKFAVAEAEKKRLKFQMRAGRDRKRALTGRCEGPKPFGHLHGELPVLERIVGMRRRGMTYQQIAERLNSEGIPTRHSRTWGRGSVYKILKRNKNAPPACGGRLVDRTGGAPLT